LKTTISLIFLVFFLTGIDLKAQTVKDADGNDYKTVKIGNQVWMAENLKTTKYNDGTEIQLVKDDTKWSNLTEPAYCWYNNEEKKYKNIYGALYTWYTVETGKLCPVAWHVSSDSDWDQLAIFLGNENSTANQLKNNSDYYWAYYINRKDETDEFGFNAMPGGYRFTYGTFDEITKTARWWTANAFSTTYAYYRSIEYSSDMLNTSKLAKNCGFSVRCVKD
jgi:uncharacterized protein (TIGR02145 family)